MYDSKIFLKPNFNSAKFKFFYSYRLIQLFKNRPPFENFLDSMLRTKKSLKKNDIKLIIIHKVFGEKKISYKIKNAFFDLKKKKESEKTYTSSKRFFFRRKFTLNSKLQSKKCVMNCIKIRVYFEKLSDRLQIKKKPSIWILFWWKNFLYVKIKIKSIEKSVKKIIKLF